MLLDKMSIMDKSTVIILNIAEMFNSFIKNSGVKQKL